MGGEIRVQTEKGKGTEFIFTVSLETREHTEENRPANVENVSFEGFRALLVEDNLINMEIAKMCVDLPAHML